MVNIPLTLMKVFTQRLPYTFVIWAASLSGYVSDSCTGPYLLRPSTTTDLDWFQLHLVAENEQAALGQCIEDCLRDPCCKAFGVEGEVCQHSTLTTESLDFVKEVRL